MDDAVLLRELEPTVERLFARHLDTTKEWFPHEHIPYAAGATPRRTIRGARTTPTSPGCGSTTPCAARSSSTC